MSKHYRLSHELWCAFCAFIVTQWMSEVNAAACMHIRMQRYRESMPRTRVCDGLSCITCHMCKIDHSPIHLSPGVMTHCSREPLPACTKATATTTTVMIIWDKCRKHMNTYMIVARWACEGKVSEAWELSIYTYTYTQHMCFIYVYVYVYVYILYVHVITW